MNVRNLDEIRARDPKLFEALHDIIGALGTTTQQVNTNPNGQPAPPPSVNGLRVSGQNGHFSVAIQDNNQGVYRGVQYYVEHADNPQFTNPQTIHMGDSRNHDVFLGNVTRYWRAYSAYASSAPGAPAYHGDAGSPLPVNGGGAVGGPAFQESQGSGTGAPGQGLQGPGTIPFRSLDGAPPTRE